MKPHRIRMTHNLLLNYGLYRKMEIYVSIDFVFENWCTVMQQMFVSLRLNEMKFVFLSI